MTCVDGDERERKREKLVCHPSCVSVEENNEEKHFLPLPWMSSKLRACRRERRKGRKTSLAQSYHIVQSLRGEW